MFCDRFCWRRVVSIICGLAGFLSLGAAPAFAGYQPDLLVKLASQADAAYVGSGIFEATTQTQSKSQPAFPGIPASFTVSLRNAGDQPDTFRISGAGSLSGVNLRFLDQDGVDHAAALGAGFTTPLVAAGGSLTFQMQVAPLTFQPGTSFRVTIDAASLSDAGKRDQVIADTVACSGSAALTLSAPPDAAGAPATVVNYPYTLANVGNADNGFALAVATPAGWNTAIYADDGAGGGVAGDGVRQAGENVATAASGVLPPGGSYRFFVAVGIPAGAADGARANTGLTVTGDGASGSDQVVTSAVAANLSLAESVRNLTRGGVFTTASDALPGDLLEYRMAVTNSGTTPATSVGLRAALPASGTLVPGSCRIGTAASGDGGACAPSVCGWAGEAQGGIVAKLGAGATEAAGGSLSPGSTLYVFFRVKVE